MIYGDPDLVVNQPNGKWRIKRGLYFAIVLETGELLAHLQQRGWQITFCWIPRDQNGEYDTFSKKRRPMLDRSG
jgi:hypothetical protein